MTRYTDIASLILVPVALVAALVAGACQVTERARDARPSKGAPIAPTSAHSDARVCLDRCHGYGMIVVEWDGRTPQSQRSSLNTGFVSTTARGCVCGEARCGGER